MARTTISDCIEHTPNHFELVLGVISRAKEIEKSKASPLALENDGSIVVALREIAAGVHKVDLEDEILKGLNEAELLTSGSLSIAPDTDLRESDNSS